MDPNIQLHVTFKWTIISNGLSFALPVEVWQTCRKSHQTADVPPFVESYCVRFCISSWRTFVNSENNHRFRCSSMFEVIVYLRNVSYLVTFTEDILSSGNI